MSRILIVDDEPNIVRTVRNALRVEGYDTDSAEDGAGALEKLTARSYDLALLDVQMLKRDGIAVAREIFAELGIPVVIISAYSDPHTVDSARDSGVFGYLVKPASIDQLRAAIHVAWKRFCDVARLADENDSLRKRLEERRVIEKAKWILVSRRAITEPDAMTLLQKKARDTRRPLVEVAQGIIDAEELMG